MLSFPGKGLHPRWCSCRRAQVNQMLLVSTNQVYRRLGPPQTLILYRGHCCLLTRWWQAIPVAQMSLPTTSSIGMTPQISLICFMAAAVLQWLSPRICTPACFSRGNSGCSTWKYTTTLWLHQTVSRECSCVVHFECFSHLAILWLCDVSDTSARTSKTGSENTIRVQPLVKCCRVQRLFPIIKWDRGCWSGR